MSEASALAQRLCAILAAAGELPLAALAKRLGLPVSLVLREVSCLCEGESACLQWTPDSATLPLLNRRLRLLPASWALREAAPVQWPVLLPWRVQRSDAGGELSEVVEVLGEVAVGFVVEGHSLAVMMATPCELDDLARGLLWAEGIIESTQQLQGLERQDQADGVNLYLQLAPAALARAQTWQRSLLGPSGCGLCGARNLAAARRPLRLIEPGPRCSVDTILASASRLQGPLHAQSGAAHAAALFSVAGELLVLREDVGRHNALDKAIGAQLAAGGEASLAILSSRASFELVQKCMQAGIAQLAALSAPTSAALDLAQQCGIELYGFVREGRVTRYV